MADFKPDMVVLHKMVSWSRRDARLKERRETEHEAVVVWVKAKSALIRFVNSEIEKTVALSSLRLKE